MIVLAADSSGSSGSPVGFFVTLAIMMGALYLLVLRPQRARARRIAATQASLTAGDQVILTSGIFGTVVSVGPDTLSLEVAPGVLLKVATGAVARIADSTTSGAQDEAPIT